MIDFDGLEVAFGNDDLKVPLNYQDINSCAIYLRESKEIKFLKRGLYSIRFKIVLSKENEADIIGLKIGEVVTEQFMIPVRKESERTFQCIVSINDLDKKLSIVNLSDDKLVIILKMGGLDVELFQGTVNTNSTEPMGITAVEQKNNKTITVTLNEDFTGEEIYTIYEKANQGETISVIEAEDSINPAPNKRVLVAKEFLRSGNSGLFKSEVPYILKIVRGKSEASSEFTVPKEVKLPIEANVDVIGDRILNLRFDRPIRNLESISGNDELDNFYISYYDVDSFTINGAGIWYGMIGATEDESDMNKQTVVRPSLDLKSMEIQFNRKGMPVGNHRFLINFSKNQQPPFKNVLKTFAEDETDEIIVPVMPKPIEIGVSNTVAVPNKATALSRTELLVEFNKPVLNVYSDWHIWPDSVITVDGTLRKVIEVQRVGNTFNKLKFVLDNSSAMNVGTVNVEIGKITDANGYKTIPQSFVVDVDGIPPRILKVEQAFENVPDTETWIEVRFSRDMKDSTGEGGVKNKAYYKITGNNVSKVDITSIEYSSTYYVATLKMPVLDAGQYELYAENIQDALGMPMKEQTEGFKIIDTSIPKVLSITFRKDLNQNQKSTQTIIIKFNEPMQDQGEHSITKPNNYLIGHLEGGQYKQYSLPAGTSMQAMKNNKWIRIQLPDDSIPIEESTTSDPKSIMFIGCPTLKDVRYIENASGNVYPLCNRPLVEKLVNRINLNEGVVSVLSDRKVIYSYNNTNNPNEFNNVDKGDFKVRLVKDDPSTEVIPVSVDIVNPTTLEFTFESDAFDAGTDKLYIGTSADVKNSYDIYGYAIASDKWTNGNVVNDLSVELKAVSLIKDDSNSAIIRLAFNKYIKAFDASDFYCMLNDNTRVNIDGSGKVVDTATRKVFELRLNPLPYKLSYADKLYIYYAKDNMALVGTIDEDNNKLAAFDPIMITKYMASKLVWSKVSGESGISNNSISIFFDRIEKSNVLIPTPINPKSLITNLNGSAWNGENADIEKDNIIFKKGSGEYDTITILDNASFGEIRLYNKDVSQHSIENDNKNISKVVLSKNGNAVKLAFGNEKDDTQTPAHEDPVIVDRILYVTYVPYISASNDTVSNANNEFFLYIGFEPKGTPSDV